MLCTAVDGCSTNKRPAEDEDSKKFNQSLSAYWKRRKLTFRTKKKTFQPFEGSIACSTYASSYQFMEFYGPADERESSVRCSTWQRYALALPESGVR